VTVVVGARYVTESSARKLWAEVAWGPVHPKPNGSSPSSTQRTASPTIQNRGCRRKRRKYRIGRIGLMPGSRCRNEP